MIILNHMRQLMDAWFACLPRRRPDAKRAHDACLVAHRGAHDASLRIQENTDAAFARALHLGCWGIEFDVHASADGVLVVNHDAGLKRLWGQNVQIAETNFKTLHRQAPLLPRLAEVVAKYGKRMHLFIELKSPFTAVTALAETLQSLTPYVDYHLLSLDEVLLPRLSLFPKESLLLVPVHNNVSQFCRLSLQERYGGVLGHYWLLRDKQIKALTEANQMSGVGFVDSKYSLYRELNRGLRFLFSNKVREVSVYLNRLR